MKVFCSVGWLFFVQVCLGFFVFEEVFCFGLVFNIVQKREGSLSFPVHVFLSTVTQKKPGFLISECSPNLEYSSEFVNTYATLVPVLWWSRIFLSPLLEAVLLFLFTSLHLYTAVHRSQGHKVAYNMLQFNYSKLVIVTLLECIALFSLFSK